MPATRARARRETKPPLDSALEEDAGAAGLRYTTDAEPGIRRLRSGRGFRYVHPSGAPVRDARTLARILRLAIPPAYRDVWISSDPLGHLQATGRDARGRKQYRYHPLWRQVRDETKFGRMLAFSRALPAIRRRVERDLAQRGMSREKVLAAVLRLLEDTCIRVGNEEYARANDSYGLTTLRDEHVAIEGSRIVLEFRGKRGKEHRCQLRDRRLARVVATCQAIPGEKLFQFLDEDGRRQAIGSGDVNQYLREASGEEFSAKDFRTWSGTLLAASALQAAGQPRARAARKRTVLAALDEVAERLHNTRAVSRKYYVHPRLLEAFEEGTLAAELAAARAAAPRATRWLSAEERTLVAFLEAGTARRSRRRAAG